MRPFTTILLSFASLAGVNGALVAQVPARCVPIVPSGALPRLVPHVPLCEQAAAGSAWGCDYTPAQAAARPTVQSVEPPVAPAPAAAPQAGRMEAYIPRGASPIATAPLAVTAPLCAPPVFLEEPAGAGRLNIAEAQARSAYLAEQSAPLGVPSTLFASHAPPPPGWGPSVYGLRPAPLPLQRWIIRRSLTRSALLSW